MNHVAEEETTASTQNLEALTQLTPREQDVLALIADGSTNRDIALQFHISGGTVKSHVTHLLTRLNLRNRAQLAIYAHSTFSGMGQLSSKRNHYQHHSQPVQGSPLSKG